MEIKKADLQTINNGAAAELFAEEFDKVLRNINDISVDAEGTRKIVLEFRFNPTKDRSSVATIIQASSRLVSTQAHGGSMFLSNKGNKLEAYLTNPNQMNLDFQPGQDNQGGEQKTS